MYAIHRWSDDLSIITLPKPGLAALPAARPNNVFVAHGPAPTLINAGHPSQQRALSTALRELDISPDRVERIIATSWAPDCLGGAQHFPQADLLVSSPDLSAPGRYDDYLELERQALRLWADALLATPGWSHLDRAPLEPFIAAWLPRASNALPILPLRPGHIVRAGALTLEVIASPGPDPGHINLHEAARGWLFTGDLPRDGLPAYVDSVPGMILGMERALDLKPSVLLPSHAPPDEDGAFSLRRALRFLNNFLSNAPAAMHGGGRTLAEYVEQDLGFKPTHLVRLIYTLRTYAAFLEELVRTRMIEASGAGMARRYGADVEDPRDEVRRR
jgi:glyoxylase-like metal-dependent hydrolase (beta-lactamase superfamily II)